MAISSIGGLAKWVELGTSSPTTGTSVSFTSLAEYKDYKLYFFDILASTGPYNLQLRINNDTGNNYSSTNNNAATPSFIRLNGPASSAQKMDGEIFINDANQISKKITFWSRGDNNVANNHNALWTGQAVINRVDLLLDAGNFSQGTIKIFGRG